MPKDDDQPQEQPADDAPAGETFEAAPEKPNQKHPDGQAYFFPLIGVVHAESYAEAVKIAEPRIKKAEKEREENMQALPDNQEAA